MDERKETGLPEEQQSKQPSPEQVEGESCGLQKEEEDVSLNRSEQDGCAPEEGQTPKAVPAENEANGSVEEAAAGENAPVAEEIAIESGEQANAEENPSEFAAASDPAAEQASFWQGGYSYQNPSPYQSGPSNYYGYQQTPSGKKGPHFFVIGAALAGGVVFICCVVMVAALVYGQLKGTVGNPAKDQTPSQSQDQAQENSGSSEESSAQRDDSVVYNAPDITTEKKTGDALSIVEINKKVKDSVVGILITTQQTEDPTFSGSGIVISADGYIITNEHVVDSATKVRVVLSDGITEYDATIVGEDVQSDLAVLKVDASGLSPAELGDSNELEVGEEVVAIGNPYGMELNGTVTNGIVSALNRRIEINGTFMTLIQTNASINPGNSGGPLVNAYGQVVGITSSKVVATGYEGIGFAIPINNVTTLTEELINYGYIKTRAYIGIMGSDLSSAYASAKDMPQGVYVSYVDPDCDAAKKGMKLGDVIVAFNGKEINSMAELTELKNDYRPGDQVTITVWRDSQKFDLQITLTESTDR